MRQVSDAKLRAIHQLEDFVVNIVVVLDAIYTRATDLQLTVERV
jgi:hypothetical protein